MTPYPPVRLPVEQLEQFILSVLDGRKAEDIISIDLANKSDFADRMVIASGTSARHVAALANHIVHALKDAGLPHVAVEGLRTADWVLVDAGDIIVHLFRPEVRERYHLEKMWSLVMPPQQASPQRRRQPEAVV